MLAWRIIKAKRARAAFSGDGAAIAGGRWNSPGTKVVYASATQSLAVLESLVHLNPPVLFRYVSFRIEFDESLTQKIIEADLPRNWRSYPPLPATQKLGDNWVRSANSAILIVPSAIVSGETNFVFNPEHTDFKKISLGKPEPFTFDPRLF